MGLNVNRISNRISEMLQLALDSGNCLDYFVAHCSLAFLLHSSKVSQSSCFSISLTLAGKSNPL